MNKTKNRLIWLDALKGIAILLVIIGHGPNVSDKLHDFIWAFHMPLFFCLAGFTFKIKDDEITFIKKKAQRLLKPYVFTVVMLFICESILFIKSNGWNLVSVKQLAIKWGFSGLYGSCWPYEKPFVIYSIGAIWFLVTLFCAEVLFYGLLQLKKELIPVFVIALYYIGMETKQFVWLPWNIQSAMVMLLFLYAGYMAKDSDWLEKGKVPIFAHIVMLSVVVMCIWKKSMAIVGNNSYTFGFLTLLGAAFISFYFAKFAKRFCDGRNILTRILCFYGENSLIILCFHLLELDFVPWSFYIHAFTIDRWNALLIYACKFIFAACAVFLVRRIKFLKWIFA